VHPGPCRIEWASPGGVLLAYEPTFKELQAHAAALAAAYSDPHNAALMGHGAPFDAAEVLEHYQSMQAEGARTFLLFHAGQFAGDADFRNVASGAAEFAFMVAATASQGRGLGTRFAIMLHWFGFAQLGLERVYASIDPANAASLRVFEKLGFAVDSGPAARGFADSQRDLVMSIDRATFERRHAEVLPQIQLTSRTAAG